MIGKVKCVYLGVQAGRAKAGVMILLSVKFGTYWVSGSVWTNALGGLV